MSLSSSTIHGDYGIFCLMTKSTSWYWFLLLLTSCLLVSAGSAGSECYKSIISFEDSNADTGNSLFAFAEGQNRAANPPYGVTHFHKPTRRYSNGRLVIDFIARALGLPSPPPSLANLKPQTYMSEGVNFAVFGATGANASYFLEKNVVLATNTLSVQVEWFLKLLPSFCTTEQGCRSFLKRSIISIGDFGENDYYRVANHADSIQEAYKFVPIVVGAFEDAIKVLIEKGAVELIVAGLPPSGCLPLLRTRFGSRHESDYDKLGCIKSFNKLVERHNSKLEETIKKLRREYHNANIFYTDYYSSMLELYKFPDQNGFSTQTLVSCCGKGGPNKFNVSEFCGSPGVEACHNPGAYVQWDGIHLTERAYEFLALSTLANCSSPANEYPRTVLFPL